MTEPICTCGQSGIHFIDNRRCAANRESFTSFVVFDSRGCERCWEPECDWGECAHPDGHCEGHVLMTGEFDNSTDTEMNP